MRKLTLEEFEDINELELDIYYAEIGVDRELDFNRSSEVEKLYNQGQTKHDPLIWFTTTSQQ